MGRKATIQHGELESEAAKYHCRAVGVESVLIGVESVLNNVESSASPASVKVSLLVKYNIALGKLDIIVFMAIIR
jgi:hypothetical protein